MSTIGLSPPAAYVLRMLMEQPHRDTAEAIADGAEAGAGIDAAAARDGFGELASRGLAAEDADGRWALTDRGRAAQQQA
jgi:hypothetical protein